MPSHLQRTAPASRNSCSRSASLGITSSGERICNQQRQTGWLGHIRPQTPTQHFFFPHSPDFLTDKGSLSHHHKQGAVCCSGKQKWGIMGANSFLWVLEQCKRQKHASVLQNVRGETQSTPKNHTSFTILLHLSLIQASVSSFPYAHILCLVTAEVIVFALQIP